MTRRTRCAPQTRPTSTPGCTASDTRRGVRYVEEPQRRNCEAYPRAGDRRAFRGFRPVLGPALRLMPTHRHRYFVHEAIRVGKSARIGRSPSRPSEQANKHRRRPASIECGRRCILRCVAPPIASFSRGSALPCRGGRLPAAAARATEDAVEFGRRMFFKCCEPSTSGER